MRMARRPHVSVANLSIEGTDGVADGRQAGCRVDAPNSSRG